MLRIKILIHLGVPENKILLHLGVLDSQILLRLGVPYNQILLHFSVPDNCSSGQGMAMKIYSLSFTLLNCTPRARRKPRREVIGPTLNIFWFELYKLMWKIFIIMWWFHLYWCKIRIIGLWYLLSPFFLLFIMQKKNKIFLMWENIIN